MALIRGVDVSEYQGDIDWAAVPEHIRFAIVRLTEWRPERGGPRIDKQAGRNLQDVTGTGRTPGVYVRANPVRNEPEWEALTFDAVLDKFGARSDGWIIPAIDIEPTGDKAADDTVDWAGWTRRFLAEYRRLSSNPQIRIYSSGSYFDRLLGGVVDLDPQNITFWVGHWSGKFSAPPNPDGDPALAEAWAGETGYVFSGRTLVHQYFNRGQVSGIDGPVDLDCLMPSVRMAT